MAKEAYQSRFERCHWPEPRIEIYRQVFRDPEGDAMMTVTADLPGGLSDVRKLWRAMLRAIDFCDLG